jgi:hypothetical protein
MSSREEAAEVKVSVDEPKMEVVEEVQKKARKRKAKAADSLHDVSKQCSMGHAHFILVPCPFHAPVDESKEPEKKKKVVNPKSKRIIELWREVCLQVSGVKNIVTKNSPFYEECIKLYEVRKKELGLLKESLTEQAEKDGLFCGGIALTASPALVPVPSNTPMETIVV